MDLTKNDAISVNVVTLPTLIMHRAGDNKQFIFEGERNKENVLAFIKTFMDDGKNVFVKDAKKEDL